MEEDFIYLTVAIDVVSRRVLAHQTTTTLEARRAAEIIEQAFTDSCTAEIVNADQGGQFTASEFAGAVPKLGCKLAMDGRCWSGA